MQDKIERGRVQIDWLTCDDHWSNPLKLYYVKKEINTPMVTEVEVKAHYGHCTSEYAQYGY